MKNYSMCIFFAIVIAGCTTKENTFPKVRISNEGETYVLLEKALAKIKDAPKKFTINTSKSQDLKLASGSTINVPANAFVDKNGIQVKGKVDIEWNEYHSIADVISSGIPMDYDSLGQGYDLVTGGMFKIKGFQKGEEVFIANNKQLQVDIASTNQRRGMNFYSFDETTQKWTYETTKSFESKKTTKEQVPKISTSKIVLDLNLATNRFPELKDQLILGWETLKDLDGKTKQVLEKRSFITTLTKRLTDSTYMVAIQLYDENNTTYELEVQPYTYEHGKAASAANKLKALKTQKELTTYFKDVASGKIVRSYPIKAFGIYNWDCTYFDDQSVELIAKLHLPDESTNQPSRLFFVCKDDNAVINLHGLKEKIKFNPNKSNYIIGITEQSEIVSCTTKDFQMAKQNLSTGSYDFQLKPTGKNIVAHQEFTIALNSVLKMN